MLSETTSGSYTRMLFLLDYDDRGQCQGQCRGHGFLILIDVLKVPGGSTGCNTKFCAASAGSDPKPPKLDTRIPEI